LFRSILMMVSAMVCFPPLNVVIPCLGRDHESEPAGQALTLSRRPPAGAIGENTPAPTLYDVVRRGVRYPSPARPPRYHRRPAPETDECRDGRTWPRPPSVPVRCADAAADHGRRSGYPAWRITRPAPPVARTHGLPVFAGGPPGDPIRYPAAPRPFVAPTAESNECGRYD